MDDQPLIPPPYPKPRQPVFISLGGARVGDTDVLFANLVYTGVLQVNVKVPPVISGRSVEILLTIGGAVSRRGVTVSVK